jgi:hypothetical protein
MRAPKTSVALSGAVIRSGRRCPGRRWSFSCTSCSAASSRQSGGGCSFTVTPASPSCISCKSPLHGGTCDAISFSLVEIRTPMTTRGPCLRSWRTARSSRRAYLSFSRRVEDRRRADPSEYSGRPQGASSGADLTGRRPRPLVDTQLEHIDVREVRAPQRPSTGQAGPDRPRATREGRDDGADDHRVRADGRRRATSWMNALSRRMRRWSPAGRSPGVPS